MLGKSVFVTIALKSIFFLAFAKANERVIEAKLDVLANELQRIEETVGVREQKLCHGIEEFRDGIPDDILSEGHRLYPLGAKRALVGNTSRTFTLLFWALDPQAVDIRWELGADVLLNNVSTTDGGELPSGVWQTQVSLPMNDLNHQYSGEELAVTLDTFQDIHTLFFKTNIFSFTTNDTVRCITLPLLRTSTDDIEYVPTENARLDLTVPQGLWSNSYSSSSLLFDIRILDPSSRDLVSGRSKGVEIVEIGEKGYLNYIVKSLQIKTQNPVNGFMNIRGTRLQDTQSFIKRVMIHKRLPFHTSSQDGPFPDNFFAFLRQPQSFYYQSDGTELRTCHNEQFNNSGCSLDCTVVGPGAMNLTLEKMSSQGSSQPVSHVPGLYDYNNGPYVRSAWTNISEPGSYRCRAALANGTQTSQAIMVNRAVGASIDLSATRLVFRENATAEFTCAAVGSPRPVVMFRANIRTGQGVFFSEPPSETTHGGPNRTEIHVVMAVDGGEGVELEYPHPQGLPLWVPRYGAECIVLQGDPQNLVYTTYHMFRGPV